MLLSMNKFDDRLTIVFCFYLLYLSVFKYSMKQKVVTFLLPLLLVGFGINFLYQYQYFHSTKWYHCISK